MRYSKLALWILIGLVAAIGFYFVFWPDIAKFMQMHRQQRFLQERIAEEEAKGLHLKKEQETLAQDPVQIEKVAREKLGLSRPHEIIYRFDEGADAEIGPQAVPSTVKPAEKLKH